MLSIQKKRVRELDSNLPAILKDKSLMLAVPVSSHEKRLTKLGFNEPFAAGDTILPRAVGPVTRFNAYGRDKIRRDLPKEEVYRSALWTREQWAGRGQTRTVTDIVYRKYMRYPREHIDGFNLELTITEKDGELYIALPEAIKYSPANKEKLTSAINIFLEAFGEVVVFDEAMEPIAIPENLRHLRWRILPPGERISKEKLEEALKDTLSRSKGTRAAEVARQEFLSTQKPDLIAVGQGGFSGYVAYVFEKQGLTLLESIRYGNATYLLDITGWEELSKLTKAQLLANNLAKGREVHTKNWLERIQKLLRPKED